ncbi:aldehyde dehydrogenase family protein [Peribacillus frigoritolerans]|uniref:aldehyde dehydrogenase family protein n=1 Tax=Peribacillus frigoritolerans TaxID=450367 RepID=UPI002226EF03|nr:aldehyde dehydrogenase family protein [Peribacillus frigoritolerans]UYZ01112.1 aldehyde dehydrogenase family protein [Peribacillus frigoritolerans]
MISTYPFVSGKYLVNGEWIELSEKVDVVNPANTSEVVGQVAKCSEEIVNGAIEAAENAFETWSRSDIGERANRMNTAAEELSKVIEENVTVFVRENGKTLVEAKKDLLRCVEVMKGCAAELLDWWKPEVLPGKQKVQIRRRARGVTAIITPWNSPMILTFKRVIPAVLAGNAVVVKPATNCPLTIMTCLKVVAEHFPPGVINIVSGSGKAIGDTLCSDSRVRTLAFVGSTETGKDIMQKSAGNLQKVYMELGGNDPAIILEDANMDEAAIKRLRMGILRAAGQVCSAVKRVYVQESRYDEVVEKLTKEFSRMVIGDGIQPDVTMGPLNNKAQYDFVNGLIERTAKSGGNIITTGIQLNPETWDKGYYMLPSIITGVDQQSELVRVEQFGPIIPILPFNDIDEAVKLANDSEFALRASVWTENEDIAVEMADRLEAGAVFHNNHTVFSDLALDFPGLKESGVSRETRHCGLEFFADSYGFAD